MPSSYDSTNGPHEEQFDRLFTVLADERRRRVLSYLHRKDGDVATFAELIDYVTVHEAESVDDLESDEVATALYHVHLPKIEDADLIEYDERSRTVRYRGESRVEPFLERVARREEKRIES